MEWSIQEILGDEQEQLRQSMENYINNMRAAIPGIIKNFDVTKQTATVQPVIKEQINGKWTDLPLLLDVPVQFPRAGGYCITFPVRNGDECLVIFADMCIDSWWQSGEVQTQLEKRRHDLSDGIAIPGITSVPKAIGDFSPDSMQIRNESGETFIEIRDENIRVQSRIQREDNTYSETVVDIVGGNTRVKSSSIEIDCPNVGINGNLFVRGVTNILGGLSFGDSTEDIEVRGSMHLTGRLTADEYLKSPKAEIDDIKGGKADIDEIVFKNISGDTSEITDISTVNIKADNIEADNIKAAEIQADNIESVSAVIGDILFETHKHSVTVENDDGSKDYLTGEPQE